MNKKIELLKQIIKDDCAIEKYPNRSYSDYDKGREDGYKWVLKKINELFK